MVVKDFTLYRKALDLYKQNKVDDFKNLLDDPVFSLAEKKLLNSRLLLRDKNWNEAIDILKKISGNIPEFLKGERAALISYAYSMKGDWQQAIIYNDKAIEIYKQLHFDHQIYNSFYNQSVFFSRLGLLDLTNYYLLQAKIYAVDATEQLSINRAMAANFSKLMAYDKAIDIIEKDIEALNKLEMTEAVASHLLVASDIYCRVQEYEKARDILNKLLFVKKVPFRSRILFESAILNSLMNEDFTPIRWQETVKEDDHYGLKAKVVDMLLYGRLDEAKKIWMELANKEPNNFLPDFEVRYKSDKNSLYYVFIQKIKNLKRQTALVDESKLAGKVKILYELLHNNEFPMSKENLIEKIWSTPYDPSFDARFYKLIQRLKSTIACEIENSHGGYLLK